MFMRFNRRRKKTKSWVQLDPLMHLKVKPCLSQFAQCMPFAMKFVYLQ